jgi:hypothetical protein
METIDSGIEVLVGNYEGLTEAPQIAYFDLDVIGFLVELSSSLLGDIESRNHGDVVAFAYWIRKSNIEMIKNKYHLAQNRVGYGMCMHIAPSNVPLNFAYSLVCSLLAGNRNIVRVPSQPYPQVDFLLRKLRGILEVIKYQRVAHAVCIVRYKKNDLITKNLLSFSDIKVIWGGDATINEIRKIVTPPYCKEVIFPDRKSVSIIDENSIFKLTNEELLKLVEKFYIDTFLFDQNACSSPRIVFWISSNINSGGRKKFWSALTRIVQEKYFLDPKNLLLKFTELAQVVAESEHIKFVGRPGDKLSILEYEPKKQSLSTQLVNRFGSFFEFDLENLVSLGAMLDNRVQTLTYFGIEPHRILETIINSKIKGVDRIVPVGKALDFDSIWDGYDLPLTLSRVISFH